MVKCKNCKNFFRSFEDVKPFYWCEKIADSPHSEMERECSYYKPKTNAERIRSMTDEELALVVMCPVDITGGDKECDQHRTCYEHTLDWLRSGCEV